MNKGKLIYFSSVGRRLVAVSPLNCKKLLTGGVGKSLFINSSTRRVAVSSAAQSVGMSTVFVQSGRIRGKRVSGTFLVCRIPFFHLNIDFQMIGRIFKINPANLENLIKIKVQTDSQDAKTENGNHQENPLIR